MKLFHGTNCEFTEIDLGRTRPNKDFGKGFYLSDDAGQALNMARFKTVQLGGSVVIQEYELDEEALKKSNLKMLRFDFYSKEWAEFVLLNRSSKKAERQHGYDFVYGPIADDKVGLQVKLFQQSLIDLDTLLERLKFVRITYQYYFGTEAALRFLKRIGRGYVEY